MQRRLAALGLLLGFIFAPKPAAGQSGGNFAIGGNVRTLRAADGNAQGGVSVGLLWRFGHAETGWGVHYGFNWYETDVQRSIGGRTTSFGQLHIRPFMAGYGYNRVFGAATISVDVIGGYAITSFKLSPLATDAFHDRLGAQTVEASAADTFVVKPEISAWIDLSEKVGLHINAGYLLARPRVTVTSSLGTDERRYRADMMVLQIGAVYSIF